MKITAYRNLEKYILGIYTNHKIWESFDGQLEDHSSILPKILNKTNLDVLGKYIEPFSEELNKNLQISHIDKNIKIQYFVEKLGWLKECIKEQHKNSISQNTILEQSLSTIHTQNIIANHLVFLAVREIQYCCNKYDVDFFSICIEVNFDCTGIDSTYIISRSYLERKKKKNVTTLKDSFSKAENRSDFNIQANTDNNVAKTVQKNEHIFCNNGFDFFKYLLNENHIRSKGVRGRYSDISFFYTRMKKDKYIHAGADKFRCWFQDEYIEEFSKIVITDRTVDIDRKNNYEKAEKTWIKNQSHIVP